MRQGRKWQKALVFCGCKAWQADKRRKTLEQAQLSSSDPSSHLSLYICFEIHHYSFAVRCIKTAGVRNENKSIKTHVAKWICTGPAWTKAFSSSHCNSEVKPPVWKIKNRKVTILFHIQHAFICYKDPSDYLVDPSVTSYIDRPSLVTGAGGGGSGGSTPGLSDKTQTFTPSLLYLWRSHQKSKSNVSKWVKREMGD